MHLPARHCLLSPSTQPRRQAESDKQIQGEGRHSHVDRVWEKMVRGMKTEGLKMTACLCAACCLQMVDKRKENLLEERCSLHPSGKVPETCRLFKNVTDARLSSITTTTLIILLLILLLIFKSNTS